MLPPPEAPEPWLRRSHPTGLSGSGRRTTRTGSLLLTDAALSRTPTRNAVLVPHSHLQFRALVPLPFRKPSSRTEKTPSHRSLPLEKDAPSPRPGKFWEPSSPGPASRAPFTSRLRVAHCWEHTGPFLPGGWGWHGAQPQPPSKKSQPSRHTRSLLKSLNCPVVRRVPWKPSVLPPVKRWPHDAQLDSAPL